MDLHSSLLQRNNKLSTVKMQTVLFIPWPSHVDITGWKYELAGSEMLTEVEYWDLEVSMSTLDSDSLATAVTMVVIAVL